MREIFCTVCEQNKREDNYSPSHRHRNRARCNECLAEISRDRYRSRPEMREAARKRYQDNQEKIKANVKAYKKKNWDKIKSCPKRKIRKSQSKRIKKALERAGSEKDLSTLEYIGCSASELKEYLESKFQKGMSWDNYGFEGWHIDHIKPLCQYDLEDTEQQKEAFHYTNLQPLWAKENLSKGGGFWKKQDN